MIRITAELDAKDAERLLDRIERQTPFAAALALNLTAEEFQAQERLHLQKQFLIRRPWVLQGIKIENADRATKAKLDVTVKVDPTRGFLVKFEEGGGKTSRAGGSLALPATTGPGAGFARTDVIRKGQRPKSYQFQSHVTKRGKVQLLGKKRTFIVQTAQGRGILQRRGRGPGSYLVRLFWLAPKAHIAPLLDFIDTAEATVRARWATNFNGFLASAMRTAR